MAWLASILVLAQWQLPPGDWPQPAPAPEAPGQAYLVPAGPAKPAHDAPSIFAHSDDVLPDQSFVLTGQGLDQAELVLWGPSATEAGGQAWPLRVGWRTENMLLATVPEDAPAGLYLLWAGRGGTWSEPVRLNAPELWWCTPNRVAPGDSVWICGRNLLRAPDRVAGSVYLLRPDKSGLWLDAIWDRGKHAIDVQLPDQLADGEYQLWVHAGMGGRWGWGHPLRLTVDHALAPEERDQPEGSGASWDGRDPAGLQSLIDKLGRGGGGTVRLPAGTFVLPRTLEVPAGVRLVGDSEDLTTTLQLSHAPGPLPAQHGHLPAPMHCVIWLKGSHAALSDLRILGNPRVHWGVVVQSPERLSWLSHVELVNVEIADVDSRGGETGALYLRHVDGFSVDECKLHGRAPLFLSGARRGRVRRNSLVPSSRYGGGAEGAILARTEPLSQCVFVDNTVVAPVGGGPQVRRLIWVSTGRGSVNDNLFLGNGASNPRFGGVAGTDQNVGEMILLESHMRYAYFGNPEGADRQSVTLPADAPFLPPLEDEGTPEPPMSEYYLAVLQGRGLGQVARVATRQGRKLLLEQPWRVPPDRASTILVTTMFARNLILENESLDGMTGIQLWIGGWQNVIARNRVECQRRQGIFLFASTTGLAPHMPPTWNRGIGPLLFNTVEENHVEESSEGIMLAAHGGQEPVEWPRALGNVIRRNTAVKSRFCGIQLSGVGPRPVAPVQGNIVEFNVLRDQPVGISASPATQGTLVRRNHVYVWDPYLLDHRPTGLELLGADMTTEHNNVEGPHGDEPHPKIQSVRKPAPPAKP